MASVWIRRRDTATGKRRFIVEYREGGRGRPIHYAGSFPTAAEAAIRQQWVRGELAARRLPDLGPLRPDPAQVPTLLDAAETWRSSRVDVVTGTAHMHRSAILRIWKVCPQLRGTPDRQAHRR